MYNIYIIILKEMCNYLIIFIIIGSNIIIFNYQHKTNTFIVFIPNYKNNIQINNNIPINNNNYQINQINELTIKLNNEINKNKQLTIEINNLKNQNNKLTQENDILKNQLNNGKMTIDNLLQDNKILKDKIEGFKLQQNKSSSNNSNEIIQLYKKIDNLNEILKRYPIILEENEKLISIIFASSDQTMHYSMICKNTDTLSDLEKKLYKEFPDFIESDNIFLCKGTVINRYKTFESYKIKNGDILVLNKRDD